MLIRAAYTARRWFDRIVLSAPMIELSAGMPRLACAPAARDAAAARVRHARTFRAAARPPIARSRSPATALTSDPVRYARIGAVIEAEPALGLGSPTIAWIDAAFRAMSEFADPAYPARIRQPMLIIAAGQDQSSRRRRSRNSPSGCAPARIWWCPGARHEILMEQDRYRDQFWAAFDAFVPGSPLFG